MDLSNMTSNDILDTASTPITDSTPNTIRRVIEEAQNELSTRRSKASTRLWEARMELQYAENEVRKLNGIPLKPVGGVSGRLDETNGA